MDNRHIFAHIDHTLLKAKAGWDEIELLCREALCYGAASVCIPPAYVAQARAAFAPLTICTVIGFPLGYATTGSKVFEAQDAIARGADELDMVINLSYIENRDFEAAMAEISRVKQAVGSHILKVIIETCYLNDEEKYAICELFPATGADFLKTSTGFGSAGAQLEDVRLFRRLLPQSVRIKAAGGIRGKEAMEAFLSAGAARLGCSGGVGALFAD
ncbi:MAG: deoxyribose-phosphate aldolase [Clostridia bacterium]|nr:deoxyribose-phosphate aldolase [Clostridia bacterium]